MTQGNQGDHENNNPHSDPGTHDLHDHGLISQEVHRSWHANEKLAFDETLKYLARLANNSESHDSRLRIIAETALENTLTTTHNRNQDAVSIAHAIAQGGITHAAHAVNKLTNLEPSEAVAQSEVLSPAQDAIAAAMAAKVLDALGQAGVTVPMAHQPG